MMQEEELVMRDDSKTFGHSENFGHNSYGQDTLPFTICDNVMEESSRRSIFSVFQIFVAGVIMLSTISGGFLEGYTSPALPSLLSLGSSGNSSIFLNEIPDLKNQTLSNNAVSLKTESQNATGTSSGNNMVVREEESSELQIPNNTSAYNVTEIAVTSITFLLEGLKLANSSDNMNMSSTTENSVTDFASNLFTSTDALINSTKAANVYTSSFQITEEEGSWLGSLLLLGAALGSGVSPWIISLGRRHAIIMSALPRLLGWILIASSSSLYPFYAGRFLCGISVGAVSSATPIYISEIAHPRLRGSLNCVVILGVNIGIFVAALFGTFLEWRGLAIVGCFTVLSYFVPSFFIPNSPSWLVLKGREAEARTSLRKLRAKGYSVENELQEIISVTEKASTEKSMPWKDLFRERRAVLPLVVVLLVTVVNRFSGYNAIITYCSLFIHEAVPAVSEYWASVAVCLVQILATVGAMSLVDSWGRRKLLLFSVSVMGLSLVTIALFEGLIVLKNRSAWISVMATMTYVGAYSIGIGPLTWVLLGELFPLDVREKASAIVSLCNWLMAFLVTKTYFSLENSAGLSGTCLIYASVCLMGAGSIFLLVPETKGRTLAEIEAHFSYPQKMWLPSVRKFDQALSSILDQEVPTIDTYSTFQ